MYSFLRTFPYERICFRICIFSFVDSVKHPVYLIHTFLPGVYDSSHCSPFSHQYLVLSEFYFCKFGRNNIGGTFYHERVLDFVKSSFPASIKMIMWFLIFSFVNVNIELSLYPGIKSMITAYDSF